MGAGMQKDYENIIIIPARGGSKSIKNKNLYKFYGKPLLYWTIKQALMSKKSKKVFVTSDCDKILKFSKNLGAEIIKRPKKYSLDKSSSEEAILHAMKIINEDYRTIVFLQATSPLRKKNDIDTALSEFYKTKSDSLFSCHKSSDWIDVWISNQKKLLPLTADYKNRIPRQFIKHNYFQQNGSIYIFKKNIIEKYKNRLGGNINVYEMEEWQSFQLDYKKQLSYMELLFEKFLKKDYPIFFQ